MARSERIEPHELFQVGSAGELPRPKRVRTVCLREKVISFVFINYIVERVVLSEVFKLAVNRRLRSVHLGNALVLVHEVDHAVHHLERECSVLPSEVTAHRNHH